MGVDKSYARFQTRAILLNILFPGFLGLGLLEALPNPGHSGLVQHELLQLPWLHGRVFVPESSKKYVEIWDRGGPERGRGEREEKREFRTQGSRALEMVLRGSVAVAAAHCTRSSSSRVAHGMKGVRLTLFIYWLRSMSRFTTTRAVVKGRMRLAGSREGVPSKTAKRLSEWDVRRAPCWMCAPFYTTSTHALTSSHFTPGSYLYTPRHRPGGSQLTDLLAS